MNPTEMSAALVLVVDDQDILRHFMSTTLGSSGFRVLAAASGPAALALCREAKPPVDLLVTDYRMPGMTGLELARECCNFNEELSVLYVSGSTPGDDLREDLALERRRFLAKPFRRSDLLQNAQALLNSPPPGERFSAGGWS